LQYGPADRLSGRQRNTFVLPFLRATLSEEFDRAFDRRDDACGPLLQRHCLLRLHTGQSVLPGSAARRPVFQFAPVLAARALADDLDPLLRQELPGKERVLLSDIAETRNRPRPAEYLRFRPVATRTLLQKTIDQEC